MPSSAETLQSATPTARLACAHPRCTFAVHSKPSVSSRFCCHLCEQNFFKSPEGEATEHGKRCEHHVGTGLPRAEPARRELFNVRGRPVPAALPAKEKEVKRKDLTSSHDDLHNEEKGKSSLPETKASPENEGLADAEKQSETSMKADQNDGAKTKTSKEYLIDGVKENKSSQSGRLAETKSQLSHSEKRATRKGHLGDEEKNVKASQPKRKYIHKVMRKLQPKGPPPEAELPAPKRPVGRPRKEAPHEAELPAPKPKRGRQRKEVASPSIESVRKERRKAEKKTRKVDKKRLKVEKKKQRTRAEEHIEPGFKIPPDSGEILSELLASVPRDAEHADQTEPIQAIPVAASEPPQKVGRYLLPEAKIFSLEPQELIDLIILREYPSIKIPKSEGERWCDIVWKLDSGVVTSQEVANEIVRKQQLQLGNRNSVMRSEALAYSARHTPPSLVDVAPRTNQLSSWAREQFDRLLRDMKAHPRDQWERILKQEMLAFDSGSDRNTCETLDQNSEVFMALKDWYDRLRARDCD